MTLVEGQFGLGSLIIQHRLALDNVLALLEHWFYEGNYQDCRDYKNDEKINRVPLALGALFNKKSLNAL